MALELEQTDSVAPHAAFLTLDAARFYRVSLGSLLSGSPVIVMTSHSRS